MNNNNNNNAFSVGLAAGVFSKAKKREAELKAREIESNKNFGVADELKKLNELVKEGLLTQAEFDKQKNKLLG